MNRYKLFFIGFLLLNFLSIKAQELSSDSCAFVQKSIWNNCERVDYLFSGKKVIVVQPKTASKGRPWIWRPAFFGKFQWVDEALLEKGFHIVYCDFTHDYGCDKALNIGDKFYQHIVSKYKLSSKVTLEGFSRGGVFALNWAARNPLKVACIYLDAPVCNLESWPSRKQSQLWQNMLGKFEINDSDFKTENHSPIYRLKSLIDAGVPILSVCGDSDKVVPYAENTSLVRKEYIKSCAPINVILKEGVDHHPHSLENPERIVDFILRHQLGYSDYHEINNRGSIQNSYIKFEKEKFGRVGFLGESITQTKGWRNMVQEELRQRFPYTKFEFINAGIDSSRVGNDILSKGDIDLLFVEAAVNDHTNGFSPQEQVRGMEGIIRNVRVKNPTTDIIMLHFIYAPFIERYKKGEMPDIVYNHERVAHNYNIPSINLICEINKRIEEGEFTWKEFEGTHPHPIEHKYYAAAISRLFTLLWIKNRQQKEIINHELPSSLDEF